MMFLLGRQAMLWHEPPMYLRSISATRFPCSAVVHAATFDPVPLPSTTRSNSSVFGACVEGTLFLAICSAPSEKYLHTYAVSLTLPSHPAGDGAPDLVRRIFL